MSKQCHSLGRFSLIVCTIARRIELERLLDSLSRQTLTDFDVIVVDSNDAGFLEPTISRFRDRLTIRHVYSGRGLSKARNVGLRHATGDVIAFPDDDCWYEQRTLEKVRMLFGVYPELDIITGRTVDQTGLPSVSQFLERRSNITKLNVFHCGNSASMFLRRSATDVVGLFDERLGISSSTPFQSGDETDFILRALDGGCHARFFPELGIYHPQIDEVITAKEMQRARGYGAGFGATLRKHHYPWSYVTYRVARPLLGILRESFRFRAEVARYRYAWACALCRGYLDWPKYARENGAHAGEENVAGNRPSMCRQLSK